MGMGSNEPISFGDEPREESSYRPLLSCCKLVILSRHCLVMPASSTTQSDNIVQTDTPRMYRVMHANILKALTPILMNGRTVMNIPNGLDGKLTFID